MWALICQHQHLNLLNMSSLCVHCEYLGVPIVAGMFGSKVGRYCETVYVDWQLHAHYVGPEKNMNKRNLGWTTNMIFINKRKIYARVEFAGN